MQSSETYGSSHPEVFLEKRVLKTCRRKNLQENTHAEVWQGEHPHFGMDVLL